MPHFSQSELLFLKRHKILEDEILDARSIPASQRKNTAKNLGKNFLYVASCTKDASHRFKTRNNHCIQCKVERIAYQKRGSATAYVYLAGSKKKQLIKVGFTGDFYDRELSINKSLYASTDDWYMLYWIKVEAAGELEAAVKTSLSRFSYPSTYFKEGRWQACDEVYSCSFNTALDAIKKAIGDRKPFEAKQVDLKFFSQYDFPDRNFIGKDTASSS